MVDKYAEHAKHTKALMLRTLILWFMASIILHFFVDSLNHIEAMGFPLGWLITAQGSLLMFVIICFWYATKQNRIDKECELAEKISSHSPKLNDDNL